jgi:hypothetical protein
MYETRPPDGPAVCALQQWYREYGYEYGIAGYAAADEEDRQRRVAPIDRKVINAARQWLLTNELGRIDSSWLRWNDGTVLKIAHGIVDERAFGRLPILHDALIDAGCDNQHVLDHLREPGEHTTCCWVVDLLLEKA